jgi:hypothetical protein
MPQLSHSWNYIITSALELSVPKSLNSLKKNQMSNLKQSHLPSSFHLPYSFKVNILLPTFESSYAQFADVLYRKKNNYSLWDKTKFNCYWMFLIGMPRCRMFLICDQMHILIHGMLLVAQRDNRSNISRNQIKLVHESFWIDAHAFVKKII